MFYGHHVQDTRQFFFESWRKYRQAELLSPLEKQIVDVILIHPEYHSLLETLSLEQDQAYFPELGQTNPFLHMGFHLAIRDQIAMDKPQGIREVYERLLKKYADEPLVEHLIMEQLAEALWQAQRNHTEPSEKSYLNACRQLLR
jgi:hypothetical protein